MVLEDRDIEGRAGQTPESGDANAELGRNATNGRRPSFLLGVFLLLLCAFVWYETAGYPPELLDARKMTGPGTFPRLLSLVLALVGLREVFRAARGGAILPKLRLGEIFASPGKLNILLVVLMTFLSIPLTQALGFSLGSVVYLFALMKRLRARTLPAFLTSVLAVAFVLLIFDGVFRVQFPAGYLTEPLGWRF